jgi:hypothetical protein
MSASLHPESLRYAMGETALGIALVACSAKGVAALFLGGDRARLVSDLKTAFPHGELVHDPAGLAETLVKAAALIDAPELGAEFTLDLRGSPIELAVWKALQGSRRARRAAMAPSRAACPWRRRPRMSGRPARPIASPSPFPATAWSRPMAAFRAIAGACGASGV